MLWLPQDVAATHWGPGTQVHGRGRLEAQHPAQPAAYTVQVRDLQQTAMQPVAATFGAIAAHVRHALVASSANVTGAELVPGFAVGDTSLVSDSLEAAMLESSLTHLVAVSGSNTGLVVAALVWLSARLGAGLRLRLAVAALGLGCFLVVVGPDASVQRAAVMAAVMLASGFGGRRSLALPSLGAAIVVLLAADPWQALQPGFALSVAATAGILLLATPLTRWLNTRARMPQPLALAFAVALAAQLSCGPLLLLLQPGLPAAGVIANVLAAPAAPIGTGLGLIAAVLAPFVPGAAHLAVVAASLPAQWVAWVAHVAANLPLARLAWPAGWWGAVLLAVCEVALITAWAINSSRIGLPTAGRIPLRQPWHTRPAPPRAHRLVVTVLVTGSLALVTAVTLATPIAQHLATPHGWAVVACDVGQGDALLLRDPAAPTEVMLVDTGDDPQLLAACLSRFGVHRIALLVLSHDDADHVGALDSIVHRVDAALVSPTPYAAQHSSREVIRELTAAGVPYRVATAGDTGQGVGDFSWHVLAPRRGTAPHTTNAASLIMMVQSGPMRVLLLGDSGQPEQAALIRTGHPLQVDVLKVAHHGSRDQDHRLTQATQADWALLSVGADNRYGHPAQSTLNALLQGGATILRTDHHGSIALAADAQGAIRPWVERMPQTAPTEAVG
ncbi:MAG: MBL fold metallo-hydrolase [Leucobacter sp.]|nr:MBL fold metallo-hydrolase [Leucobacter sp.]